LARGIPASHAATRTRLIAVVEGRTQLANVYSTLCFPYQTPRGDSNQSETMCLEGLKLHKALGNKNGMVVDYGNLTIVYRVQGKGDQAELGSC
jgi:hypothetical protein